MANHQHDAWWSNVDALESQSLGMFVGGMILDLDPACLSKEPTALPEVNLADVNGFLDSIGARRIVPERAKTVPEMKRQIVEIFKANAQIATIAARNFEALPDEAVESIYDELLELQERARSKDPS